MAIIWVTGARGFIGKNLSIYLAKQGNKVLGIGHGSLPKETIANYGLSHWINGEIEDSNLHQLLEVGEKPEVIYHLAGGSSVGLSMQTPAEDFRRSAFSTALLLEWIRNNIPETKLVVSSSAAIYGNTQMTTIVEDGYFIPYSPYGFNKRVVELLCESYAHNFGLQIAIVRLFSVYGPGLYKQLLWDLCSRLHKSPSVLELHGTGNEIRDWLYIEDAIRVLTAAASGASNTPFIVNGGTGIGTCVRDVANLLCLTWDLSPKLKFSGKQRAGDPFSLVADTKRLETLGFIPTQKLTLGLPKYVSWFRQVQESKSL